MIAPIDLAVGGGNRVQGLDLPGRRSAPVDSAPQVAKLRAASGTRDSFNPAVRFQIVERQPELSSGLFAPERRDFGVVLSQLFGLCFWPTSLHANDMRYGRFDPDRL